MNPKRVKYLIDEDHGDELAVRREDREPWTLDYVTQRMGDLRDVDLLERVPPADSGLYQISPIGVEALRHFLEEHERELPFRELVSRADDSPGPLPDDLDLWAAIDDAD